MEIGNGDADARSEHVSSCHLFPHLVDSRCAATSTRSEPLEKHSVVQHRRQTVSTRVAEIHTQSLSSTTLDDVLKSTSDLGPRFVPIDLHMAAIALHQGFTKTVRILVQLLQRGTLGTDEPVREDICQVTPNSRHFLTCRAGLDCDLETASRFTQGTCSVRDSLAGVGT